MTNPLVGMPFAIPFDRIRAEHVEPAIERLLAESKERLGEIGSSREDPTYANTMQALDEADKELSLAMTVVEHLESVANTPELREVYNRVQPEVSAFYAGIPLDSALWARLLAFSATEEARRLTGPRARYLKKTIDDFRRHGAELDPPGKRRLEEISRELAEVTSKYGQNVLDATAAFDLVIEDESKLAGLPESARAQARASAKEKGREGWRFTLHAPSLTPVLTYLDDAAIREQIYRAYNTRASSGELANQPLIARTLELRREEAELLGYRTFADLVLEDRMAKSAAQAKAFVDDLTRKTERAFARETEELERFRASMERAGSRLEAWDVGYYSEKQQKALYDFDEEELRPYFAVERTIEGLFAIAERLYGLRIAPSDELPGWHPDVHAYDLHERDGPYLGSFYVDLYPRDEKRGGAWMSGLITEPPSKRGPIPQLGLVCASFTPPVDGRPALLTHSEVTTLFHEFGHLLHHLLSRVEVRSLGGTNVAWDFVELPSQIMENWCWEREALDMLARHVETGETIPEELFQKMRRARTYRAASVQMRQLGFAAVDLALHVDYDPSKDGDVVRYSREIMQRYATALYPEDYAFICGFGHLFSSAVGYAAGYYSYKWAEVLDADAFTRFLREGVFSPDVGRAFRAEILERGDGADPAELYRRFMGRDPSLDALLERNGLL